MKDLLDKLSSYNLFNYLVPGALFAVAAEQISAHRIPDNNLAVALVAYYFLGLVISRIGSLILEPMFKRAGFVSFAAYRDYLRACAHDQKLDLLSEQNNLYRTLCSLLVCLGLLRLYDIAAAQWVFPRKTLIGLALFLLFAFSYRKQTDFIKRRVEHARKD